MRKAALMLTVVGGIMVAGIALSFFGSSIVVDSLVQATANIGGGDEMEVSARLDPGVSGEGFYVVQTMQFEEGMVRASVKDPSGAEVAGGMVGSDSHQEQFDLRGGGNYTLVIENGGGQSDVVGAIGHVPGEAIVAVGVTGSYLLIAGLVGMAGLAVYIVKSRNRPS
ncbi:hypothetical protein CENSYa_1583 [Cenarchaeum symbiosum A]|uniref:Uncharacterized protein n=1 Tax=Cenarchaeum symbiosum (strain A) TaxID=414004 RepID=A0RXY6_CENSY|nr:hypothetical protein CENSYa_1583 [Cenarchaeum symbiosum A]